MSNLRKWADEQQYIAAPIQREPGQEITPKVHLLWMTPDPLGAIAAMCRMYEGKPTYNLMDITDDERERYFQQVQKTHLQAPLEAVRLHFFIEGVTRSFTHQMVRQRTAVYAQESLRFAVKDHLEDEISVPPSIAALPKHHPTRQEWDKAIKQVSDTYNFLVNNGIPAEDARGLMPHAVATRLNYNTDLRNLIGHAGNRLCTQAQFEWRIVFMGIVDAIRTAGTKDCYGELDWCYLHDVQNCKGHPWSWQYEMIADSNMFRPICYQLGRCQFNADFDRHCSIRQRVDEFASEGIPSTEWDRGASAIQPEEWLLDPAAARITSGGAGHD